MSDLRIRVMTPSEFDVFRRRTIREYAAEHVRAGNWSPDQAARPRPWTRSVGGRRARGQESGRSFAGPERLWRQRHCTRVIRILWLRGHVNPNAKELESVTERRANGAVTACCRSQLRASERPQLGGNTHCSVPRRDASIRGEGASTHVASDDSARARASVSWGSG